MTKRDIVLKISEACGVKQTVVKRIVQGTFDAILESLQRGERVEIRNFGVFFLKKRKRKIGRNPKTGEVVPIPERVVVVFKPGLKMKPSFQSSL
ncbi:MAG: integration host factor subunit beta [Candidatus Omnitrophica bacterium]|nr:integration host factor subunit beta [Candidatus Omnitrophota bacterium]